MGEKKRTLRGFLCAALGGVCWGASGTVGQYLFTCQGVDSGWLTVVRMFLAGVVLLGGALVRHRPQLRAIWSDRRDALRLVLFSVGGLMTCQYTYLAAIRYSNSATATVLQYMGQALILLWVCLRARRLPTRREGVALVLALLGAFLLATHGSLTALALSPQALGGGADALYAPAGRSASALSRECLHGLRDVHRRRGAARAHAGVADSGRAQRRGGARHAGDLRCRHGACIHALSAGRERRRRTRCPWCSTGSSPAPSRSARRCARRSGCTRASRGRIFSALLPFW